MKIKILVIASMLILFVNNLTANNWTEKNKIVASDRAENDYFGQSVAIDGNYAIVGAYGDDNYTGSAYIFKKDAVGEWSQVAKLTASDRAEGDYFGYSVAISGNFAIVGAYQEDEDATGDNTSNDAGSVYFFKNDGNDNWTQVQKKVASNRGPGDYFGYSVAISGEYAAIGAVGYHSYRGLTYILKKGPDDPWTEIQIINASNDTTYDYFGSSVSIDKITTAIVVGAENEGNATVGNAGCAYIFNNNGNDNFSQTQKIVASTRQRFAEFGHSVAIYGNYVIIGANGNLNNDGSDLYSGAAYIFEKDGSGNWTQKSRINAGDDGDEYDYFGISVSIDSNFAIVGACGECTDVSGGNCRSSAGAVYIYKNDGSGNWNLGNKIVASDRSANDYFGWSVAIDGNWVIAGANQDEKDASGNNPKFLAGSAYFFTNETITEYHVSTSGNDATGNGSSTSPWASVQKAVNSFSDPSVANTAHIENGVYNETVSINRNFSNLSLSGANAKLTVIQAAESVNDAHASVFTVADSNSVRFENMTIRNGNTLGNGGGICNGTGSINISNCTLQNNQSLSMGGGIYNKGICVVQNSTFSGNKAVSCGGAYAGDASTKDEITNSTFFNNSGFSGANGGAIFFTSFGHSSFYVTNCTIANNSTGSSAGEGGGIFVMGGTLSIKNTILANNQKAGSDNDFFQDMATITDNGYNIVEASSGYTFSGTGDLTGTDLTLNLSSTLEDNNTSNGTQTLKLTSGSVAINAGNTSSNGEVAVPTKDQRGFDRNGMTDIGAYEYQGATGVTENEISSPSKFELSQNYPNPFNPTTMIMYVIARSGATRQSVDLLVQLKVYDALGREVATLVNKKQAAGKYSVQFDASKLSSGIYYYTLQAGEFTVTKKMVLIK